jgi:hypothetical protein
VTALTHRSRLGASRLNLTFGALVAGGDDFIGIDDPLERFGIGVVIVEKAMESQASAKRPRWPL